MPDALIKGALTPEGKLDVLVSGQRIAAVGSDLSISDTQTTVVDGSGKLLWPGLINTHHHSAQSLLKGVPAGINAGLDEWLGAVPFAARSHLRPQSVYVAAQICFAEMLRSGCTTCVDHHYLYTDDTSPEMEAAIFQAADEVGIRFLLARGGSTHAGSHAGQRSQQMTEQLDSCLRRLEDTFNKHHDADELAMSRLVVAPTSLVHSSSAEDLRQLAAFARSKGLLMHSHLLEVSRDETETQRQHGCSAVNYAESVGWLGDDVWFAHLVACDDASLAKLAATATSVSHCPVSNARLGSGVARIPEMAAAGIPVTLGVDGSASAESGSLINEMMQAWLIHRSVGGADSTETTTVFDWATRSAANLLRLDVGRIQPGSGADLLLFDLSEPRYFGVWQPEMAPVLCGEPVSLNMVMVNGKVVVRDNQVIGLDVESLQQQAQAEVTRLQQLI